MLLVIVVANVIAIVPSARISDRIGRKPVIYAACVVGGIGVALAALAPAIPLAIVGGALFGVSAGTFLAVDWALMTDIIPKASSGRYMGLSNVATTASTLLAVASGGLVLDAVNASAGLGAGPRAAYLLGAAFYVVAAITLRPVVEPPRGPGVGAHQRHPAGRLNRPVVARHASRIQPRHVAGRSTSHGSARRYSQGTNAHR